MFMCGWVGWLERGLRVDILWTLQSHVCAIESAGESISWYHILFLIKLKALFVITFIKTALAGNGGYAGHLLNHLEILTLVWSVPQTA